MGVGGEKSAGASEEKRGRVGGGRSGTRVCKTFFNGPVLVYQFLVYPLIGQFLQFLSTPAKRVICDIHVNQHYGKHGSRARFRLIQVMWNFAKMSLGFF